ncbi:hypothetical protein V202x_23860 [Gimesia aquarii]|uniref:Alginate export domain-containing protein n=1 Tax=Gimesia aquarii TaxID=2527964 RepID=A0A517WUT7_9PLAN|nr:hypothetical protein V202x_23860 [Gimesia aquarii]
MIINHQRSLRLLLIHTILLYAGIVVAQDLEEPGRVFLPPAVDESQEIEDLELEKYGETYINPFAERVEYDPSLVHDHDPLYWKLGETLLEILAAPAEPLAHFGERLICAEHYTSESPLDEYAIGLQPIPDRPNLLVETNEKFLDIGFLNQGIVIPTGAVWRPSIWVFGTYRTGLNYFNNRTGTNTTEWANRLDLFGQLNLSGTERILLGLRSLDKELTASRLFTGYDFHDGRWLDGLNADIQTLFFEGDFGEIFPNLDPYDVHRYDIGFSVGRQPMSFQQGLLINEDMVDAVTVTRNTVNGGGILNMRITGVYVEGEINRNNNVRDPDSRMYGIFTETDLAVSTVNADVATVHSSNQQFGSMTAFGLSAIQRLHGFHNTYNTSFQVLGSFPHEGETAASGQGELLFSQISLTPHHSSDLVYFNAFLAIDEFTSPARGTLAGGPLGQVGLLFAAAGLGQYGAPLSNQATDAAGASLGYQLFYDKTRQQLIFEIGGRKNTKGINDGAIAGAIRYQKAIGQHWIMLLDSFVSKQESRGVGSGARIEFLAKF